MDNRRLNLVPVNALTRPVTSGLAYSTIERNTWRVRTTEYLPDLTDGDWTDNDRNLVYTNEMGQVLMKVFQDYEGTTLVSSQRTAFHYDAAGRLILTMQPSAVTGHTETLADLIEYNTQAALLKDARGGTSTEEMFGIIPCDDPLLDEIVR